MPTIVIDTGSKTPHYDQLRAQLTGLIAAGHLPDGTRLPTVRALANDLGIAVGTVARTYHELERAGLVTSMRRLGTRVCAPPATLSRADIARDAEALVTRAHQHGLTNSEIQDVLTAALAQVGAYQRERPREEASETGALHG